MRGFHRPIRLSDFQPDAESDIDLDGRACQNNTGHLGGPLAKQQDPQGQHAMPVSRPWTASQNDDPFKTKTGERRLVQQPKFKSSNHLQSHKPDRSIQVGVGPNNQREGPAQPRDSVKGHENSRIPSRCADCSERVEQAGAKPQGQTSPGNLDYIGSNFGATYSPNQSRLSSTISQSPPRLPRDFEQFNSRQNSPSSLKTTTLLDKNHLRLRQLPSVSSLGIQESDLDPPPPVLALRLTQNSSSQISLPSDVGEAQSRNLGGPFRPIGDRIRQGNNPNNPPQSQLAHSEAEPSSPSIRLNSSPSFPRLPRPPSRPQSTSSIQYDWSRRPEQIASSRDPASPRISSFSHMEKLKGVGRFRRISSGANQPDAKAAQQPKKHFERLSGIFGRGNARTNNRKSGLSIESTKSPAEPIRSPTHDSKAQQHYLEPLSPRPDSRITRSSVSSVDFREQTTVMDGRGSTFTGHQSPPREYYGPDSLAQYEGPARTRLSYVSPTEHGRLSPQSPRYPPPGNPRPQQRLSSSRFSSPLPSPIPRTPPSRGRSEERTYAQDLHLRSRSPKAFPPRQEERDLPNNDVTDPASNLGIFRTNPRTSRVGDQERPWKLTLPGEPDDPEESTSSWLQETTEMLNSSRLPTYQEDAREHDPPENDQYARYEKKAALPAVYLNDAKPTTTTPNVTTNYHDRKASLDHVSALNPPAVENRHPHRSGFRTINSSQAPVELPVRADDDSTEEIVMTSTAYPGQEWRPLGFSEWDHQ